MSRRYLGGIISGSKITPFVDWSDYAIIPYHATANTPFNKLLFFNIDQSTVDYVVTGVSGLANENTNIRIIRFDDYIFQFNSYGGYTSRWITSDTQIQSGEAGLGTNNGQADVLKFGKDKLACVYGNETTDELRVRTFSVANGVLTTITNLLIGTVTDYRVGYSSPAAGAQITLNKYAEFEAYHGKIKINSVYSYPGSVFTYVVSANLSADGTTVSVYGSGTPEYNFSRPVVASGDNGYVLVSNMDMGKVHISNNESTPDPQTNASGNGFTSYSPCPIHKTNGEYMMDRYESGSIKLYKNTSTGFSSTLSITGYGSDPQAGMVQTIKNGCFFVYNSSAGLPVYRKYINGVWGSESTISGYSTGAINYNKYVKKIVNY